MFENQRNYLLEGNLRTYSLRLLHIHALKNQIKKYENEVLDALHEDIGKSRYEADMMEYRPVLRECDYFLNHLKELTTPEKKGPDLMTFPAGKRILRKPYGQVLIQSPWNYPFQLALIPVIGAICAGNTVVLKTSRKVPRTNEILGKIFEILPEELLYFATDLTHDEVLSYPFDFYFFTGSKKVGKKIYRIAAENMAPCVLELGGKSPCIVDHDADCKDAAKKIAWGKFSNAGQTCVAPDYLLLHREKEGEFLAAMKEEMKVYENRETMPRIITEEKFNELLGFLEGRKEDVVGGKADASRRVLYPTLLLHTKKEDPIMEDEIFGPILPVLLFDDLDDAIRLILEKDTPLALYLFSKDKVTINRILSGLNFGGACLDDTVLHLASNDLPFGGMNESGIGTYHGPYSFELFTHGASLLKGSRLKNPLRFPPYTEKKHGILKKLL